MHERICAPVRLFFAELRPRVRRTMRQFAEEEIILPNGPRENLRFSCAFMPWTGLVLDVFQSGKYRKFFLSGPAQSGKTLVGFVIPTIYQLFEMEDDVIIGVPDIGMAQGIYSEKILPIIQKSRFADQLPVSGEGSRGGKFQKIEFRNGAVLRFMGAGGGDGQRSSHTAPMVDPMIVEAGIDMINPCDPYEFRDLSSLKEEFGSRITLVGGLDKFFFEWGYPEMKDFLFHLIKTGKKHGGFILMDSGGIPESITNEKYNYYREISREYRYGN
jgi:hypothetical protein